MCNVFMCLQLKINYCFLLRGTIEEQKTLLTFLSWSLPRNWARWSEFFPWQTSSANAKFLISPTKSKISTSLRRAAPHTVIWRRILNFELSSQRLYWDAAKVAWVKFLSHLKANLIRSRIIAKKIVAIVNECVKK